MSQKQVTVDVEIVHFICTLRLSPAVGTRMSLKTLIFCNFLKLKVKFSTDSTNAYTLSYVTFRHMRDIVADRPLMKR